MIAVFSLMFLPVILFIALVIIIPIVCVSSIRYKKYYVQDTAAQKAAPQPSLCLDQERVKVMYRRDYLDRFIRGSLSNVRDWRVVGDSEEHDMFYTSNILKCKSFTVIVYFLDGTEAKVSVDTSSYKRIEEEKLSFISLPKPDNEQKKIIELTKVTEEQVTKENDADNKDSKDIPNAETPKESTKEVKDNLNPESLDQEKQEKEENNTGNVSIDDIANQFFSRKDVFDILERRKDIVLEDGIPEGEEIFERCKKYLMIEHAVYLYKSSKGWGFNFS